MTRHPRIVVRAVTWNLFHGRDFPPDRALFTLRSRLLRITECNATHVQVNRPLREEFTQVLGRIEWDVALLQEAPPRWREALARDLDASDYAHTLTSRNRLGWLRGALAQLNTDLIASNEGGSNQLLVRAPWRIAETREHTLAERPERRRMLWARLDSADGAQLAVANVHGSLERVPGSAQQLAEAAAQAHAWAGETPLIFGGDFNQRPDHDPHVFAELRQRFGLAPPTAPRSIDHLLARGLEIVEAPRASQPRERELDAGDGRALRLSDHAYVTCAVSMK